MAVLNLRTNTNQTGTLVVDIDEGGWKGWLAGCFNDRGTFEWKHDGEGYILYLRGQHGVRAWLLKWFEPPNGTGAPNKPWFGPPGKNQGYGGTARVPGTPAGLGIGIRWDVKQG